MQCRYCGENSIPFIIVGKGSNCLFDDLGYDGCVIQNRIEFLEMNDPGIYRAGSGFPFKRLGVQCSSEGYTGLEFAGGIPGTVGGAVYMNAGANGQVILTTMMCSVLEMAFMDVDARLLFQRKPPVLFMASSLSQQKANIRD